MPTQFREKKFEKILDKILPGVTTKSFTLKVKKNPPPPVAGEVETPSELNRRQNGNVTIKGL